MSTTLHRGRRPSSAAPRVAAAQVPILIVDDDASKRLGLKAVLAPLGYAVVEAASGFDALRCIMGQNFAVILLDVKMPIMDGFETAALIRQRQQSEMTPIIFITAHGKDEINQADLYAEGAVDFIFAPVPPDELRAKVSVLANLFANAAELEIRAKELQTSAQQFRLLTDAAPVGIFQTDARNRYVYTNPRWSEITATSAEEALGRGWETIIGAEQRALVESTEGALDLAELSHRFEIQVPGEATRIVLLTSRAIPDSEGGVAGWVGTLADVTAETDAEAVLSNARDRATEASRLKSDFLANMSHEIRTPMNGVIGMTDLLLETELDARQRDYAQTVRNSGEALLTIINDILDFSKVESGKLEIEDIDFNVRAIVDGVVDLLAGPAQIKGIELVAVIESSVPAVVSGDPGRVRQVLTNLIGNAIKFTPAGEIVVRVTESEADADGADTVIRFEVSDTGVGIAPDKLELVFQPFVQADTSTSRSYGGTGLGLAICSQLVSLMGGNSGVWSRIGVGSSFWFTISVHAVAGQVRDGLLAPEPGFAGVGILIVDDNAAQRSVLSEFLNDWGMAVSAADSGEEALTVMKGAVAAGRPFAVVVLDQSMPKMDGWELNDAIRTDPELDAHVVLMNSLRQGDDAREAAAAGISATLSKPIHRDDLRTCVRIALGLQTAVAAVVSEIPAPSDARGTGRLLLAEDNPINQKVALAMLSSAGYQVDTVPDGIAAVEAATAHSYDAILMDCQMPEMSGYEATAAIRVIEGPDRHTPIIAMTAGARREDRERCLREGMDSYVAKPVSKDALLALVRRFVHTEADVSAPPPSPEASVPDELTIDPSTFEDLRLLDAATDGDLLSDLVAQFVHETEPLLVALREGVERGDAEGVQRTAHSIKGSSVQLGGLRLSRSCGQLEQHAADRSSSDRQHADLLKIEADYQLFRQALTEQLDRLQPRSLHA